MSHCRLRRHNNTTSLLPPDDSEDSLVDDSDEDPDYTPGRDKKNKLALFLNNAASSSDVTDEDEENIPSTSTATKKKIPKKPAPAWNEVNPDNSEKPSPPMLELSNEHVLQSPVDYFKDFFDNDLLTLIATQSNLYSVQKNPNKPLNTSEKEVEQFIGICIYMSIYGLPRSRMYWNGNTRVEKVAHVMSRNRWEELKANLHFNNNDHMPLQNDPNKDRLFKIRPLVDALQNKFKNIPIEEQMLCVDEQIVPFKGTSLLKQYNPMKPHKWGYKLFVLCDSKGLIHNFEIYTGRILPATSLPDIGASSNVVLRLVEHLPRNENKFLIYFDNWYSSPALLVTLANIGFQSLGTIRLGRFPGLLFSSDQEMKKKGRGSYEEKEATIDGVKIRAVKWLDNRGVSLASTFESACPINTVQRFDSKGREQIDVTCPKIVTTYNKFMGGVDLLDGLISYYRINLRSRKFYLRFFFHFVDVSIVNGWLLFRRDCQHNGIAKQGVMDLLAFRCEVAESLCNLGADPIKRGRPSTDRVENEFSKKKKKGPCVNIPIPDVRKDGVGHWPSVVEDRQRCKQKSSIMCEKCKVHLCLNKGKNCFVDFHL
ncbi:piggyBac transposable element-derived protein 4-like [Homalodisca vitripennis]|uniref:piggyBac transposable element-derived protein 4-like n=1 Tax=Homalodisca vitripennis TaxID=197043 RepID=UPI001EEC5B13|nr:piggyBac transposable element-derived protein 4-like [Homalodisca vitripennis]